MTQKNSLRQLLEDEFSACADALAQAHRYIEAFWENPTVIDLAVRAYYVSEEKAELPYQGSPIEEYLYGELFNKIKPELERRRHGFVNAPVLRPSIGLYPDLWHTHFMAAVMGVQVVGPEGVAENELDMADRWCRPFLSSPAEVDKIVDLDVLSHPSFIAYLKDLVTIREITGGVIPIEVIYGVGPVDVAADLLGYEEFLTGLYTHPQEMHKILELCTDYWIQIIQAQIDAAGWVKNKRAGPLLAASEMIGPQVSLEQIREFFMPVRRRLAGRFGCGATTNHPDIKTLDLWMELGDCKICFLSNDYLCPADYVLSRMGGKAVAVIHLNHDPGHLPCPSWEEQLARFRTFAGQIKMLANLTGIRSPGAEECALQHLQDLQSAWASSNHES